MTLGITFLSGAVIGLAMSGAAAAQDRSYSCIITVSCDTTSCMDIGLDANISLSANDTRLHVTGATGSKFYERETIAQNDHAVIFDGVGTAAQSYIAWPSGPEQNVTFELFLTDLNTVYLVHCPGAVVQ